MFLPRPEASALAPAALLGLRRSLNTPVVGTAEIPLGPARAILAVHRDEQGSPSVTLGVRSLRSGRVALYGLEGQLADDRELAVGIDAALSFGESLGFLFDDDELAAGLRSAEEAALLWSELVTAPAAGPAGQPAPAPGPAPAPAAKAPDAPPSHGLSKFRRPAAASAPAEPVAPARRAPLARLRLVKRRISRDQAREGNVLLRLLSSF